MKFQRKLILTLIGIVIILSKSSLAENNSDQTKIIYKIVENFCQAEFEGDGIEKREKLIRLSPKREKEILKQRPEMLTIVFDLEGDSLIVVSSYTVKNIVIKKNDAIVYVEYSRLARRINWWKVIPDQKENDIVAINLKFDGKRWWVYDPPTPKISKDKLISFYEEDLGSDTESWFKQATPVQIKMRNRKVEALNILKNLK